MARPCTICEREDREAVDEALIAGGSFRGVARRFGAGANSVERHAKSHVVALLARRDDVQLRQSEDLHEVVVRLREDAERIRGKAEREGDLRCAVAAVKTSGEMVSLLLAVEEARGRRTTGVQTLTNTELRSAIEALGGVPLARPEKPPQRPQEALRPVLLPSSPTSPGAPSKAPVEAVEAVEAVVIATTAGTEEASPEASLRSLLAGKAEAPGVRAERFAARYLKG